MTKAEEILEKHLAIMDAETMIGKHGRTHKAVINAINEAINYTRCCEKLRDEYLQPELDKYKNIKVERQSEPLCDHDFKPNKQGADVCVKCGLPYTINCG